MTPARKARLLSITREIAQDCKDDTDRREGEAFTGANVAAALGETSAMIAVLANIVEEVLRDACP